MPNPATELLSIKERFDLGLYSKKYLIALIIYLGDCPCVLEEFFDGAKVLFIKTDSQPQLVVLFKFLFNTTIS